MSSFSRLTLMDSPTLLDDDAPNAAQPEQSPAPATATEDLDCALANDLLQYLRELLTCDIRGNFHIKGAHTGKDGRHDRLVDVGRLIDLLEAIKTQNERKMSKSRGDGFVEGKRGGKFTSTQMATVTNLVQQQIQEQLAVSTNSTSRIRVLEDRLGATEACLKQTEQENEARLKKIQHENEILRNEINRANETLTWDPVSMGLLQRLENVSDEVKGLRKRVAVTEDAVKVGVDGNIEDLQARVKVIEDGWKAGLDERIAQVSAKQYEEQSSRQVMEMTEWCVKVQEGFNSIVKAVNTKFAGLDHVRGVLKNHLGEEEGRNGKEDVVVSTWLKELADGPEAANPEGQWKLLYKIASAHDEVKGRVDDIKERILEIEERQEMQWLDGRKLEDGINRDLPAMRKQINNVSSGLGQVKQGLARTDESVTVFAAHYNELSKHLQAAGGSIALARSGIALLDRRLQTTESKLEDLKGSHERLVDWAMDMKQWTRELRDWALDDLIPGLQYVLIQQAINDGQY